MQPEEPQLSPEEASSLRRSLQAEVAAHAETRRALHQARVVFVGQVQREQKIAEGLRQTLALERESFADQLRAKDEALAEATRIATSLRATVAKLEEQSRAIANLATASLAQWFYDGDSRDGQDTPEYEFSRVGNQRLEELYGGFLVGGSALVQLPLGRFTYDFDFQRMTQVNTRTGKERCIRRKVLGGAQSVDLVEKVRQTLEVRLQEVAVACEEAGAIREELEQANWELWDLQMEHNDAKEKLIQAEASVLESNALMAQQRQDHALAMDALMRECEKTKNKPSEVGQRWRAKLDKQTQDHAEALAALRESLREQARTTTELWKSSHSGVHLVAEPLEQQVQDIFQSCSHQEAMFGGEPSRCFAFQGLRVEEVRAVHNPRLYSAYKQHLSDMRARHSQTGVAVRDLHYRGSQSLASLLPGIRLGNHELLLVHGCTGEAAMSIIEEGFDVRRARQGLYGGGVYFASEMCKSDQYAKADPHTGLKHMIIARVALGDPAQLTQAYQGKLPPQRLDSSYYDSAIADPAFVAGQQHFEFIIFKSEQAYPEFLVTYSCP